MKKIDNIKKLYSLVGHKAKFIIALAKYLDRSENTLANHYFSRFWNVPKDSEDKIIEFMQTYIRKQNDDKNK